MYCHAMLSHYICCYPQKSRILPAVVSSFRANMYIILSNIYNNIFTVVSGNVLHIINSPDQNCCCRGRKLTDRHLNAKRARTNELIFVWFGCIDPLRPENKTKIKWKETLACSTHICENTPTIPAVEATSEWSFFLWWMRENVPAHLNGSAWMVKPPDDGSPSLHTTRLSALFSTEDEWSECGRGEGGKVSCPSRVFLSRVVIIWVNI